MYVLMVSEYEDFVKGKRRIFDNELSGASLIKKREVGPVHKPSDDIGTRPRPQPFVCSMTQPSDKGLEIDLHTLAATKEKRVKYFDKALQGGIAETSLS
jgi:hypothetical protein